MTDDPVRIERHGRFARVVLADPAKRNALGLATITKLTAALTAVGESDVEGVVLAADGPVFSAGHDFGEMVDADLDSARLLFGACTRMMDTLQQIPQPVVARVQGLATAAGCQLVAACDLAVAARSAGFALPGGRGGLFCHTPVVEVVRTIGRKRALEMALTGDIVDAETAVAWGLVNRVVPDDELDTAVDDLLQRACRGSVLSKGLGKHGFYAQLDLGRDQAYALATEIMAAAVLTPDAQEGIDAFLHKRAARFGPQPSD